MDLSRKIRGIVRLLLMLGEYLEGEQLVSKVEYYV